MKKHLIAVILALSCLLSCSCHKKITNGDDFEQPYQSYYCPVVSTSGFPSENNKLIAYYFNGAGNSDSAGIYVYDVANQETKCLLDSVAADGGIDFSPNGQWIVFSTQKIWKKAVSDSMPTLLASDQNGGYCCFPDWSPDSQKIAFDIDGGPNIGIWTMDPEGNNRQQIIACWARDPAWSPDNRMIYYQKFTTSVWTDTTYMEIYSYDFTTKEERRITYLHKEFAMEPAVSPSGEKIVFTVQEQKKLPQIWITGKNGENPHQVTIESGCNPVFYSENELLYAKVKWGDGRLWIIGTDGQGDKLLF